MQPDSIIPNLYNPQSLNRFSYVSNRPINFNDPTGHMLDDGCRDYGCGGSDITSGGGGGDDYCTTHPWACGGNTPTDDVDEILSSNEDSDGCTSIYDCVPDCNDPSWGCVTDVGGTWEDPAVYIAGSVACLATGLCVTLGALGASGISEIGWGTLRLCAGIPVCLTAAIRLGIYYPTNQGFSGNTTYVTLQEGQIITRYGDASGSYASPIGTSIVQRALPFHQTSSPLTGYQVLRPFGVTSGTVQSFYGMNGGGIQYWFRQPIQYYIDNGFLSQMP